MILFSYSSLNIFFLLLFNTGKVLQGKFAILTLYRIGKLMENTSNVYLSDRETVDLSLTSPWQEFFIPFTCPPAIRVLVLQGVFLDHVSPRNGPALLCLAVMDLH